MQKRLILALLFLPGVGLYACNGAQQPDTGRQYASAGDFFFYSCVNAYMKAHAVPLFDGSLGYAVEYSDLDAEQLAALYEAAEQAAASIPAPDYDDAEHGRPAVLAKCQQAADRYAP